MPIYEYQCRKCGIFEVTRRITDPPLKRCPTCKGKVERLVSRSSFILKGTGWYATDYGRKGSSAPPPSESSASSSTPTNGSTADAKSESKPEAGAKSESAAKSPSDKGSAAKSAD
ncbi:MAG TPA: zinc ribbon domain-containing protein [Candidatus Binataceae bacterium]|nr:zinc ribbon domain-containing protein [Candidatus Binataceae bacterium]